MFLHVCWKEIELVLHFVGFRGNEYLRAIEIWGHPDFIHQRQDARFKQEYTEGDKVIFANGHEKKFAKYSYDDSSFF